MRLVKIFIATFYIYLAVLIVSCKPVTPAKSRSDSFTSKSPSKAPAKAEKLVGFAEKFLGTKYKSAGTTPAGFDCSGFCLYVFNEFGFELPRRSDEQAKMGKPIPINQAQRGDLIFFKGSDKSKSAVGHVGIVVSSPGERIKFIHSSTSKGIIYDYLDVKYFSERFVGVKRVF